MEGLYALCAGHKKTVTACPVFTSDPGRKQREMRTFATTNCDLLALRDWLLQGGCTHVAMESTGDYWKPVYDLLEEHVSILLLNAKHVKDAPGRKPDVKDAKWLADLLRRDLMKDGFVPPRVPRELRELISVRCELIECRARAVDWIQEILLDANIRLGEVTSDIMGVSGRAMLSALAAGESDPEVLADLARGLLRLKRDALIEALDGLVGDHHRFILAQQLEYVAHTEARIADFDEEIDRQIERMNASAEGEAPHPDSEDGP